VSLDWAEGQSPLDYKTADLWLMGTGERLILFSAAAQPQAIWRGDPSVQVEALQKFMGSSARLVGGEWLAREVPVPAAIRIAVPLMSTYNSYFRPLLGMLRSRPPAGDPAATPESPSTL
jgi:hypothetical protein